MKDEVSGRESPKSISEEAKSSVFSEEENIAEINED